MAYPTIGGPYGFRPVNLIGGQHFAGSTREHGIIYNYGVNIGNGDIVNIARGNVTKNVITTDVTNGASTTVGQIMGIFMGCSYTSPATKQKLFSQYWPASTAAGDGRAIICDDPDTVFKAVVCSATTVVASGNRAAIGQNYGVIQNAVNTTTGDSQVALLYSATLTTNTMPFRAVGLVPETAVTSTAVGSSTTTSITCSALTTALVVGTDVGSLSASGQYIASGSFVSVAAAVGATTVTLNVAPITDIASGATIIFTQYPEVLVKFNFGVHSYYAATAV